MRSTKTAETFVENIRGLLKLRGWTQDELGKRADLPTATIWDILREKRNCRLNTVEQIARAFGVSAYEMLKPGAFVKQD